MIAIQGPPPVGLPTGKNALESQAIATSTKKKKDSTAGGTGSGTTKKKKK